MPKIPDCDHCQFYAHDPHPIFTGMYPKCGREFGRGNLPLIHWDCPACKWVGG